MAFFAWLRSFWKPRRYSLIAMRAADMALVHPLADFSRKCSRCGEGVGLYPSGQSIIERLGEARVEIVCNRCVEPKEVTGAAPAPGALKEVGESISNPRKE